MQNRIFNSSHYNKHQWLEYSLALDAIFCYACRNYNAGSSEYGNIFIDTGFKNWKEVSSYKAT